LEQPVSHLSDFGFMRQLRQHRLEPFSATAADEHTVDRYSRTARSFGARLQGFPNQPRPFDGQPSFTRHSIRQGATKYLQERVAGTCQLSNLHSVHSSHP
jgi:hypothetical protein